jgi:hypothetical protein
MRGTKSVVEVFLNGFREVDTIEVTLSANSAHFLKQAPTSNRLALRNMVEGCCLQSKRHNLSTMGNAQSKEDDGDYMYIPDESWLEGMLEGDEGEMDVDEADAVAFCQQLDNEYLQLDDCVRRMQDNIEEAKSGRESHGRTKDLWSSTWGRMLKNPFLNDPKHWVHRDFVRRFRLPYQLFKQVSLLFQFFLKLHLTFLTPSSIQLVVECEEVNLFDTKRRGKIPIEFRVLIGLRILARDSCADDLDELLNIGGSTINNIFKQFVTGMATKLYDRHVHVPEGAELDKIVETYTR